MRRTRIVTGSLAWTLVALLASSCGRPPGKPVVREMTITAIPELTKETQGTFPFLAKDFAPGGLLEGKEVYSFEPSAIIVYEGDTVRFTLVNPADDPHSFSLPPYVLVDMPPTSRVTASFVARSVGSFRYFCAIPSHLPFMYGWLTVLPARDRPAQ